MSRLRFEAGDRALTVPPYSPAGIETTVLRVLSLPERMRWALVGWWRRGRPSLVDYEIDPREPGVKCVFCADRLLMPLSPDAHDFDAERDEEPVSFHAKHTEEVS